MTDLAKRFENGLGRIGRLALRVVLVLILASPIVVGFLLAPKAGDMPPPPKLTAPASVTTLPEAVRRVLPTAVQDTTTSRTMSGG